MSYVVENAILYSMEGETGHINQIIGQALLTLNEAESEKLVSVALAATARVLRSTVALLWVYDGRLLRLVGTPPCDQVPVTVVPGEGAVGRCFGQTDLVPLDAGSAEEWVRLSVPNPDEGPVHGCLVTVMVSCKPVGVAALIRVGESCFDIIDKSAVEAQTLRLVLSLHHCVTAPEIRPEWMTTFEEQIGPFEGVHRLSNCPMLLFGGLPKGIHGPTLKAMCRWVHVIGTQVTRKEAADALGLSGVTVGRYLSYMVQLGLVKRAVEYRQMGRPTYLYSAAQRCPQLPIYTVLTANPAASTACDEEQAE